MKFVSLSLIFAIYSALSYCQVDYSKLPEDYLRRIKEARQLLNGSDTLFLVEGVNGVLSGNNHICWYTSKRDNNVPTHRHNTTYYTVEKKKSGRRQRSTRSKKSTKSQKSTITYKLESRDTYWSVGTINSTPVVSLNVYDAEAKTFNISGDYLLLETQPTCIVMGILTGNKYNSTCLHWVSKKNLTTNCTLCNNALYYNCSSFVGDCSPLDQRQAFATIMTKTVALSKGAPIVIAGDFNDPHTALGYPRQSTKGNLLVQDVMLLIKRQIIDVNTRDTRGILALDFSKAFDNMSRRFVLDAISDLGLAPRFHAVQICSPSFRLQLDLKGSGGHPRQ
ncbi:uncharacterized protein LOC142591527 [Dermacentor variabilis]|uniref:uncharacterized protein LOC142591527 n=1 Tax=Dermacentor variabilis TaxID=34621 RepID=UPI003F5B9386